MPRFNSPIDLLQSELRNAVLQNLAADPGTPKLGQMYFKTGDASVRVWTGSAFTALSSGTTPDATTGANGVVRLAGDLGGAGSTAAAPIISALAIDNSKVSATAAIAYSKLALTGAVVNADLAGGIAYSKLSLGTSIVNADVAGAAAIAYSKLALGGSILNADVNAAAAIAYTKLALAATIKATDLATTLTLDALATQNVTGADVNLNTHKLINVQDPSSAQHAATKNYVDSVAQGLTTKASVRAATVGTETYTVAAGSVTQIAGTTLDTVSPAIGDRILINDAPAASGVGSVASTQPGNGIYTVTNATTNLTVTRATDMAGTNGPAGAYVFVEAGGANGSSGWVVSSPSSAAAFTYGTTPMQWTQFSGAGEITAGTGLAKAGNTLSIENSGVLLPAHGGTGVASPAAHGVVIAEGAAAHAVALPGTTGIPLVSAGAAADPAFGAVNLTTAGSVTNALPIANGGTAAATAAAARTSLATGGTYSTTFTGNAVLTSFTVTPPIAPVLAGAWNVSIINQSTGAIEFCDITINQGTNVITVAFTTAPANGLIFSVVVAG